jgi:hypothetical protein
MKYRILLLTLFILSFTLIVKGQIPPNAFNYSAVARNAAGQPIVNTTIGIQISILKTSTTGASQYSENHFVNTDAFGLFNLIIGAGSVQGGSMANIDWSNDNYYLKVGMDANGGTNFLAMGTTQLLSVPYALYAKSAGTVVNSNSITITSVSSNGDTLFFSNGQFFLSGNSNSTSSGFINPIITTAVSNITSNSVTFSGVISNANNNQIIERGIVYSETPNPQTLTSNKIKCGFGVGNFDTITGLSMGYSFGIGIYGSYQHLLKSNTNYYARSYVITENNISAYGNEVSFTTLPTGQIGQAGGIVFFDKGNAIGGWQYLETATSDQSNGIIWGCDSTLIPGTQLSLGSGEQNTALIVAGCNAPSYAAKLCDNLTLGGQSDWYLPSVDELYLMYKNLHLKGLGNFFVPYPQYWSSSDFHPNYPYTFAFEDGRIAGYPKYSLFLVRAIRSY